ncbi:MAG: hypothetical protein ABMB14_34420, partial [Myxococcota bacterium]
GGVFLSSSDAWQLVRWLEAGVEVGAILGALERAAEARRKARSRTPLSLVAANRHLGRPGRVGLDATGVPGEPPLAPIVRALAVTPATPARQDLDRALLAVDDWGEGGVRQALAAVRAFLDRVWDGLGAEGRAQLRAEALVELGDLASLVDEGTLPALIDETARDRVRQRYPSLTAATLAHLLTASSAAG